MLNRNELVDLAEEMTQVVLNQQRFAEARRFWNADMAWRGPLGLRTGVDDFTQSVMVPFFRAFPDYFAVNDEWVVDEEQQLVASWGHFTATHRDTFCGVAATGLPVDVRFMDIWKVVDDKLQENWVQVDHAAFLSQVGATTIAGGGRLAPGPASRGGSDASPPTTSDELMRLARESGRAAFAEPQAATPPWREDVVLRGPWGIGDLQGAAAVADVLAHSFPGALSGFGATAELWVVDASQRRVGVWGHVHGRHTSSLLGVPPTGKEINVSYLAYCAFDAAGRLETCWAETDTITFLRDVGALSQLSSDALQRAAV